MAAQTALTNLFLDTWHDEADIGWLAAQLRETGFSVAELECILRREVAPAFGGNLLSIAGEWARWSAEEVEPIIARRSILRPMLGLFGWRMVRADWHRVRRALQTVP